MDQINPVYTEKPECQDCYKCVRECPVKAIRIESARAHILYDNCILCGHCVEVCPVGAKKVRDDVPAARRLLRTGRPVYVSLAPSYINAFPGVTDAQLIHSLKRLGFTGVSETALGAQEVNAHIARGMADGTFQGVVFSSACPTAVEFIRKYYPRFADAITPLFSPLLAHARLLRQILGSDTGVVFIGPCIAKKREADRRADLLDAALTFEDLATWFAHAGIRPEEQTPDETDQFTPHAAECGRLYPIEGGMIAGIRTGCATTDAALMSFSGIANMTEALRGLETAIPGGPVFVELLACEGGCVRGPKMPCSGSAITRRQSIIRHAGPVLKAPGQPAIVIKEELEIPAIVVHQPPEREIRLALAGIGKTCPEDELNCGGCGYDSCRDFAHALLAGIAERPMCVSTMRKLAQKKANALIKTMPGGVVIADSGLRIVECNERFARLMGEETRLIYDAKPGLEGVDLRTVLPFTDLFTQVMETGQEITGRDINVGTSILRVSLFVIEQGNSAGCILEDVTLPVIRKEEIIENARQVIEKNLATVQQIAYLMGENAAETEIILNSIIGSFAGKPGEAGHD